MEIQSNTKYPVHGDPPNKMRLVQTTKNIGQGIKMNSFDLDMKDSDIIDPSAFICIRWLMVYGV
jgi:hypothetical protein